MNKGYYGQFPCMLIHCISLFGILRSYLFLHIWENILLKLVLKYMKLGKIKAFFGLGVSC